VKIRRCRSFSHRCSASTTHSGTGNLRRA
jgi:hypothetical protein